MLAALVFLAWVNHGRRERVEYVTRLGAEQAVPDPTTATGWAGNRRWLIAPEHNNDSYQWIMETQQMLATGDWRLRRVAYDNGIEDRAISSPAPYRWWLALGAKLHRLVNGTSLPLAVERVALWSDPVMLVLILLGGMVVLALRWGVWPAAVWLLGGATLYPFSAAFVPGAPDSLGLSLGLGMASVLFVVLGHLPSENNLEARSTWWMLAAGVAGGLGLWVNLVVQLPILVGLALGGAVALLQPKVAGPEIIRQWRIWSVAGAVTALLAFRVEHWPGTLSWKVTDNHPLVVLAWLGLGELLVVLAIKRAGAFPLRGWLGRGRLLLAVLALGGLAFSFWKSEMPWLKGRDVFGTRLTSLPQSAVAEDFGAWLGQGGPKLQVLAVLLPLSLLAMAVWCWFRKTTGSRAREALAMTVLPLLVLLPFAFLQLRWWSVVEGMLLLTAVTITAVLAREARRVALGFWVALVLVTLLPGVVCQRPAAQADYAQALSQLEVESLVERSLAHWVAEHAGRPVVMLAPPFRTTGLCFHGNLRGLGSLNLENKEALGAAARIASANSPDEALALINKRGVTHLVIPSWDGYLEEYARLFTSRPENSFIFALKQWAMPPWMMPIAYQLPTIGGFEGQSAFLFEIADEQDQATTLSRLAEYFLEMGQGDLAMSASRGLAIYPENLPALAALGQIELARGDGASFAATFRTLLAVYASTEEHDLSWDRRVSLAVVLMQGKRTDLARREMEIALNLMDEARLRSLSIGSLYRFQVLLKALGLKIEDGRLQALAGSLLPEALRGQL